MDEFPLSNKIIAHMEDFVNTDATVSDFIDNTKRRRLDNLRNFLADDILVK